MQQSQSRPSPPPPHKILNNNLPPLPPGWIEYRAQGGKPYWFNTFTRQSTWNCPYMPAAAPPPPFCTVKNNNK
ncbi:unnamed protein product [Cunninghamella echinulata]